MKSEEYYRVVSETPFEGFTVEERYKVVSEIPSKGFTAEEFYKIIEGPEKADSLEDLDKAPEGQGSQTVPHQEVESKVKKYFKSLSIPNSSIRPNQPIPIGNDFGETDLDLYLEVKGKCIAIAEFKTGMNDANYGRRQLFSYLSATNTRFGIFANNLNADDWIFYENLRHFRFRRITRSQFEKEVKKNKYELPDKHLIFENPTESPHQAIDAMEPSQPQTSEIQTSVGTYFSHILEQEEWGCRPENDKEVRINAKTVKTAHFVLRGRDGSYVVIVEFRNVEFRDSKDSESSQTSVLNSLLCATDTRFGVIAVGSNPNKWKFYERLGSELPRKIEHSEFDRKVVSQVKEAACPVFKGDKISKEDWDKYSKTWNTLKSEKVWRVVKTYHPKCPLKIDEYISEDDYKRAQESYPGCSVKKDDILTKAELDEQHKTWPKLTTVKGWRVIEVFHSGFPFTVGQYMSHIEYKQARVDYPGCPVKRGDILTKTEWEKYKRTWKGVNAELVWYVTNAEYERTQIEYQSLQNERDISRSKIKLWQFVTVGVSLFLVCFGVLFLMQRRATEDAVRQIATLVNQRTQKETEIRRNDWKIQSLTTSVQNVNSTNEILSQKISELENQERNRIFPINESVVRLRKQLNEEKNENQTLQSQLNKKDTEIRQLQNDITIARNENRRLQNQTDGSNSGIINQNDTVQRLKKEKAKVFNENQRLRDQNQVLIRQNQNWQDKNEALQKRLDDTKQNNPNQAEKLPSDSEGDPQPTIQPQMENLMPEPPKKIQEDRPVRSVDISRNRQGCFAFEGGDYDKAIRQFEQVIKADSELEIAHYNLGCTFLEMKDYPKAISAFDEAVAINHKFKEAHYNLGLVHLRNGAREQAKSSVERALGIDKNYQRARSLLAIIEKVKR